jgi:hypothetical protein
MIQKLKFDVVGLDDVEERTDTDDDITSRSLYFDKGQMTYGRKNR